MAPGRREPLRHRQAGTFYPHAHPDERTAVWQRRARAWRWAERFCAVSQAERKAV